MRNTSSTSPNDLLENIRAHFEFHGRNIYGNISSENNSLLYSKLSLMACSDPEVLMLVANADFAQQVTNLLFAAVQFLLFEEPHHPLAAYYPNFTDTPLPIEGAYPHFHQFCLEYADEIKILVTMRRVQTNEVGRCAGLLTALGLIAHRSGDKPLALIEIGTSAGLHLLWDEYSYAYGDKEVAGNTASPVKITCAIRGEHQPPVPSQFPQVDMRIGIDLNPIDVHDETATHWLQALIWPEHRDRHRALEAALSLAKQHDLDIVAGDAAATLSEVLAKVPDNVIPCVFHSYTLNQMPQHIAEQTLKTLSDYFACRVGFRISQEWYDGQDNPHLHLFSYNKGQVMCELLAYCESHGRWIEWLQTTEAHS